MHEEQAPVVAVVDTGISYIHKDIDDNLWINQNLKIFSNSNVPKKTAMARP